MPVQTHTHTHTHTHKIRIYRLPLNRVIHYTPPSPTHVFNWLREVTQRNSYILTP